MQVGVVGMSHRSAELQLRELLARACQKRLIHTAGCVVLSTCNRTEIYFSTEEDVASNLLLTKHSEIMRDLRDEMALPLEPHFYSYFGRDCFAHLAMVTAGIDSVILGESEIQRQVKVAYENAMLFGALPKQMHFLFQKCLKIGKEVRTTLPHLAVRTSMEAVSYRLGCYLLGDLATKRVLFVGNSEINRKILGYFRRKGIAQISLCTRGVISATEWAQQHGVCLLSWDRIALWQDFELTICGTNAPDFVLTQQQLRRDFAQQSLLILDLAIPRNVDPNLGRHPRISLFNIEALGRLAAAQEGSQRCEIALAREGIRRKVQEYARKWPAPKLTIDAPRSPREGNHIANVV